MLDIKKQDEVIVQFKPTIDLQGPHTLLRDAKMMAIVFESKTHVIAAIRYEDEHDWHRKYDNDSLHRQRGTFEKISSLELWEEISGEVQRAQGSISNACVITAITNEGSGLDKATKTELQPGEVRRRRREELIGYLREKERSPSEQSCTN